MLFKFPEKRKGKSEKRKHEDRNRGKAKNNIWPKDEEQFTHKTGLLDQKITLKDKELQTHETKR